MTYGSPIEPSPDSRSGVSFIVPVRNGARWIHDVLDAIRQQDDGRPMEIIVVDDRSEDESRAILDTLAETMPLRILNGSGRGAASAINLGMRAARFPLIGQVDQDVIVGPGWMRALTAALDDPKVAAAQGYYANDRRTSWAARTMALDLERRYARIPGDETEHVCTGNAVYRAEALERVGGFDESFGYGYDNDMSYRLRAAGYRLRFRREARSTHRWRAGLASYLRQQYGFGYGRLDLVARHLDHATGDSVSPLPMMLHPIVMAFALLSIGLAAIAAPLGESALPGLAIGAGLVGVLAVERLLAGIGAARRFGDPAALLFPAFHLARDVAWVGAIATWTARRLAGRPSRPGDSMHARPARGLWSRPADRLARRPAVPAAPRRLLAVVPAHNEADALPGVIADLAAWCPDIQPLVVDDGSTDDTPTVVEALGVAWIRLPHRMGVGSVMRTGLRYAIRMGYDAAVRVDGDGQHRADDVARVIAPLLDRRADVVLGSRYAEASGPPTLLRLSQRALGSCLSAMVGRPVTDPTSGFCALGPRALRVLADHHPTGYPEPELQLLASRNGLMTIEVPVRARPRQGGRTSLTPGRVTAATMRVLLAMVIVPLRGVAGVLDRD